MKFFITTLLTLLFISCQEQSNSAGGATLSFAITYKGKEYNALSQKSFNERNSVRTDRFSGVLIYPRKSGQVSVGDDFFELNKTKYKLEPQQIVIYEPQLKTLSYFESKLPKEAYKDSKALKKETMLIIQKSIISTTKNI